MAKSLRSKWKRKMKAAKRERYGAKELIRLKTMLENAEKKDVDMSDVFTRSDAKKLKDDKESIDTEKVEMDIDKVKRQFSSKTMKDEHGNYPEWMSQRAIKKKKGIKKGKRKATWR